MSLSSLLLGGGSSSVRSTLSRQHLTTRSRRHLSFCLAPSLSPASTPILSDHSNSNSNSNNRLPGAQWTGRRRFASPRRLFSSSLSSLPQTTRVTSHTGAAVLSSRLQATAGRQYHASSTPQSPVSPSPSPPLPSSSSSPSPKSETPILKQPITRVTTREAALKVLRVLNAHPEVFWACDTEVADIDVKTQGESSLLVAQSRLYTLFVLSMSSNSIHTHTDTHAHTQTPLPFTL